MFCCLVFIGHGNLWPRSAKEDGRNVGKIWSWHSCIELVALVSVIAKEVFVILIVRFKKRFFSIGKEAVIRILLQALSRGQATAANKRHRANKEAFEKRIIDIMFQVSSATYESSSFFPGTRKLLGSYVRVVFFFIPSLASILVFNDVSRPVVRAADVLPDT